MSFFNVLGVMYFIIAAAIMIISGDNMTIDERIAILMMVISSHILVGKGDERRSS